MTVLTNFSWQPTGFKVNANPTTGGNNLVYHLFDASRTNLETQVNAGPIIFANASISYVGTYYINISEPADPTQDVLNYAVHLDKGAQTFSVLVTEVNQPMAATPLPTPTPGTAPTVNHKPYICTQTFLDDDGDIARVRASGGTQAEAENFVNAIMQVSCASVDDTAAADLHRTLTVDLGAGENGQQTGNAMDAVLELFRATDRARVTLKLTNMSTQYLLFPNRTEIDVNNSDVAAIGPLYRDRYDVGGFVVVKGNSD